jgi:hypothetical protein
MATIRPNDLPAAASVSNSVALIIDTGSTVEKATPLQVVDAAVPLASQAEAEAGVNNTKRVTPLRLKQAIDALTVSEAALAAGGAGQGAGLVGYKNPLGGPAILRLLRDRAGETVYATDYIIADGNADDHQNLTELQALNPAEIVYPPTAEVSLGSQLVLTGNRTHRFLGDARVTADVAAAGVRALGFATLMGATTSSTIARGAYVFSVSDGTQFSRGQFIYIYDVVTAEYDPQFVRWVDGNTVYVYSPVNYNFATAANIRFYDLSANPLSDLKIIGGTITNANASLSAHGLQIVNAINVLVDGTTVADTGGIGITTEIAMRMEFRNIKTRNTGASGFGLRNVKHSAVFGFDGLNPNRDESFTCYKNVVDLDLFGLRARQYLFGQAPAGNVGSAGNCFLFDERCTDIMVHAPRGRGSATYMMFINNQSDRITVVDPDFDMANLGLLRVAGSNDVKVRGGRYRNVVDAVDSEIVGNPATAAVQDDVTCSGTIFDFADDVISGAAGVKVRQLGTAGRHAMRGLPTYADNTAALAGGLTAGAQYRTATGVQMVVY